MGAPAISLIVPQGEGLEQITEPVDQSHLDVTPVPKGQPNRQIYDLQFCKEPRNFPGLLVRSEGDSPTKAENVNKCYELLGTVHEFFLKVFERDSVDGIGGPLVAFVNYDFYFPGGWWEPRKGAPGSHAITLGNGWDNDPWNEGAAVASFAGSFGNFAGSLEVVAHEVTHGITESIVSLGHSGQSGAIHEHLADVFASMCEQWHRNQSVLEADWLIGEDLVLPQYKGTALRSMKDPGSAYNYKGIGKDTQVKHMSQIFKGPQDNNGVHINSGILNRAFYLVATKLGGYSWEVAGRIWWQSLNDKQMKQSMNFRRWAELTWRIAEGFGDAVAAAVGEAWLEVGVLK